MVSVEFLELSLIGPSAYFEAVTVAMGMGYAGCPDLCCGHS